MYFNNLFGKNIVEEMSFF